MSIAFPIPRGTRETTLAATSGQTAFGPINFLLYDPADVAIDLTPPGGARAEADPSTYTIAPAAPATAFPAFFTVTFAAGLVLNTIVDIRGRRTPARSTDVTRAGVLQSQALERELDKITLTEQELRRDIDRSLEGVDYINASADFVAEQRAEIDDAAATAIVARDAAVAAAGQSLLVFPTLAAAMATPIPIGVKRIMALSYAVYGDHGEAQWVRAVGPAGPGKRQFSDLSWWKLDVMLVNPYMLGAKGDGVTNDTVALQELLDYLDVNVCQGILPAATFRVDNLRTKHSAQSDYIADAWNGSSLVGMGRRSILKGAYDNAPSSADYTNYLTASMGAQALLSIYRSNMTFGNFAIHGARVGIFLGQDPTQTTQCSVASNNIISDVWMERVGTCVLMQSGLVAPTSGVGQLYYNKLSKFHLIDYGIGVHMAPWIWGVNNGYPDLGNNNRNTISEFRGARGWCNYLIHGGDGNDFISSFSENATYSVDGPSFVGASPSLLMPFVNATSGVAWLFAGQAASNNRLTGGSVEAANVDVIDAGFNNAIYGTYGDPQKSNFTINPQWRGPRIGPLAGFGLNVGGKSQNVTFISAGSATVTVGNVGAGATNTSAFNISVPGAKAGDFVEVYPNADFPVTYVGRVYADDVVTVAVTNSTSATYNVTSQLVRTRVMRLAA